MIVLRTLGTAEIETDTTVLTPAQHIVFAAGLYLILEGQRKFARTRLASILWPRAAEPTRSHRLRQTLLQLRKAGIGLSTDRNWIQLQDEVRRDIADSATLKSWTLEGGEFLAGYTPAFSESFSEWLDLQREATNALLTGHLVNELAAARSRGDWSSCDRLASTCRRLDPYNEAAVLASAEASAMRGAKTHGIEILDRYLSELGPTDSGIRVPASVLRKRIRERIPERTNTPTQECEFVGRHAEMEFLTNHLHDALRNKGGACLVKGEAGIGKSRIASELARFGALEGVQTVRTSCRQSDLDRPLSAFVDLVPQLQELPGALGCSQETVTTLKRLTEVVCQTTASWNPFEDLATLHGRLRTAFIDLLDAVLEEQCVLIIIDDVQWLDASSRSLLGQLNSWAESRRLLFVLTERTSFVDATHFSPLSGRISLTVGPLRDEHATELLEKLLNSRSRQVTPSLIGHLLSVGEGNPFFLQELGNHWLATGRERDIPESVTAIIEDRLAHLSNGALTVLQACAVLGVNATLDRVERLLEYKAHSLLAAVEELSCAGMLDGGNLAELPSVAVRHELIASGVLNRTSRASFGFLHRRAGLLLERETQGDAASTAILWACAFHWRCAGDRERAFRTARTCAEHLLEVGLPRDAARALKEALDYCVTDDQRRVVLAKLAAALQMDGCWEESREVLRTSRQLQINIAPNANTHDDVEFALFEARWRVNLENSALLQDLRECVRSVDASTAHRISCGLLALKVACDVNRMDAMKEVYEIVSTLPSEPETSSLSRFELETIYHSICGDFTKARDATDSLLDAGRREKNPLIRSRALVNVAIAYRLAGRKEDAVKIFAEAFNHSVEHGLVTRTGFAALGLVRTHLAAGELTSARETMTKLEALSYKDQDVHAANDRIYLVARLALEEGNLDEARAKYDEISGHASTSHGVNRRAANLALGIRIAIAQSKPNREVWPMVLELERAHREIRGAGWQDFETYALGLGLTHCGNSERALSLLDEYATVYRRERGELPKNLKDLLLELRANHAVSATRRMEPLSGVR